MIAPIAALRDFREWRRNKRAAPIDFSPNTIGRNFGFGIGSNQPRRDVLLKQELGAAAMANRAISNRVSGLNPQVFARRMERGVAVHELIDDHPLKTLLDNPHKNYTRRNLLRLTSQYILTVGEAYWLKIRNRLQTPVQLQPMPSQSVEPIIVNGMIDEYRVKRGDGVDLRIPATEIVRMWWPDPETLYTSEGILGPNAVNADAADFASRHLRSRFQNDAIPPIMLKATAEDADVPGADEWKRWKSEWVEKYHNQTGNERGTPGMIPPGWDAIQFAIASGADITPLLEYWQANQLMNYGVPQSVLGRVVSGDRSAAETTDWIFDKRTVLPVAELISDAISQQLAPDYDPNLIVEFAGFVSEDKEHLLAVEAQDLTQKVRSVQQVIEDRGGDPDRAPWGEKPVGTIADTPYTGEELTFDTTPDDDDALGDDDDNDSPGRTGGGSHTDPDPITQQARTSKARNGHFSARNEWERQRRRERKFVPRLNAALVFIFNQQRIEALRELRKQEQTTNPRSRIDVDTASIFDPEAWNVVYRAKVEPIRRAAYVEAAVEAYEGLGIGGAFQMTPTLVNHLVDDGARMVRNIGTTTQARLAEALEVGAVNGEGVGQIAARINRAFGFRRKNAKTIARTELIKATQRAQIDSFQQAEVVPFKRWNDNLDSDVRDSHFGSLIDPVRLEELFVLANGATAMHPGDASLAAADLINCRCFVTPVFDDPTGIVKGDL